MDQQNIILYLEKCRTFRLEMASRSRAGSSSVIKNEQYAYSLERVIEYVTKLPDDDPVIQKLSEVGRDLLFDDESELHTQTIHCSLGKPANIPKWFADWADSVITATTEQQE